MLTLFRTRKQNEEVARDEIEEQLRKLRRDQFRNDTKLAKTNKKIAVLSKDGRESLPLVQQQMTTKQILIKNQSKINESMINLESHLSTLNNTGDVLSQLKILPVVNAATKVSNKSVIQAKTMINKINENTLNRDALEDVLLQEVDVSDSMKEWETEQEQLQLEEMESQMIQRHQSRQNKLNA